MTSVYSAGIGVTSLLLALGIIRGIPLGTPGFSGVGNCIRDTAVPRKESLDHNDDVLWSILSTAPTVRRSSFNFGGHTHCSSSNLEDIELPS